MRRLSAKSLPLVSLAIAVAAVATTYIHPLGHRMVFDRDAILHGELWRLVSGHLYHYSPPHLWSNLLPLIVVGAWIEKKNRLGFAVGCLLMAAACGTSLFLLHPFMDRYGGLSGIVCGLMVFFGLCLAFENGAVGWIGRFILTAMVIKTGHEWYFGSAWLVDWDAHGFVVMPLSHLVGMIAATVWFLIQSVAARGGVAPDKQIDTPASRLTAGGQGHSSAYRIRKERQWCV